MASDERERDPTAGIERRDPDEVRREVDARRVRRRLKAAASLILAATAGTFLACIGKRDDKNRPTPAPNPTTTETSNLPAPPRPDAGAARPDAAHPADARAKPADARAKPADARAKIDRAEHRKGMPVRDNLLE
jgi:hypothetical protein